MPSIMLRKLRLRQKNAFLIKKRVFVHAYSKPCQKSEMEPLADIINA